MTMAAFEQALIQYLPDASELTKPLYDAMQYALTAGGKRLRPQLFLATISMFKTDITPFLPIAVAIEYVHTYSLIHDDLPCMDDDDLRRGRPTCHIVFGEAQALLTGDALLTHAFSLLSVPSSHWTAAIALQGIARFSRAIGPAGMVGGQSLDMLGEVEHLSPSAMERMHRKKTGALFQTTVAMGGLFGGATAGQLEALERFGDLFGLAFQITDDILDKTGEQAMLGKPVGSDEKNKKTTYVTLYGLSKAQELAAETGMAALRHLQIFGEKADSLREITRKSLLRQN